MDVVLPAPFNRFPRHRAKAEAACRAALADSDVVAMVVTESFATGGADELSDVDLRVYVRTVAVERVVARIPDLAAAAGRVVALFVAEHLGIPTLTIVLYDDLVHVDFDVVAADRAAEHNDGLPAVVLWEREPISDVLPCMRSLASPTTRASVNACARRLRQASPSWSRRIFRCFPLAVQTATPSRC